MIYSPYLYIILLILILLIIIYSSYLIFLHHPHPAHPAHYHLLSLSLHHPHPFYIILFLLIIISSPLFIFTSSSSDHNDNHDHRNFRSFCLLCDIRIIISVTSTIHLYTQLIPATLHPPCHHQHHHLCDQVVAAFSDSFNQRDPGRRVYSGTLFHFSGTFPPDDNHLISGHNRNHHYRPTWTMSKLFFLPRARKGSMYPR